MKKPKIIRLHPYPFDIVAFIGTDVEELKQWIQEEIPEQVVASPEIFEFDGRGRTIRTDGGWILLWTKDKPNNPENTGFLIHEIFHAVEFLYDRIGIKYNIGSGEAWAYMIQYVFLQLTKGKGK